MATKRYAFCNYGGQVLSVETRCSGCWKNDVQPGELALEQIICPDMLNYYIEITADTGDAQLGYVWSSGKFLPPEQDTVDMQAQITALGQQVAALTLAAKGGVTA